MIKIKIFIITTLILFGCKKDPTGPDIPQEDFSYPPSGRFAVSLYSNQTSLNVNSEVDIRLVFYNLNNVFGSAIEIIYDKNKFEILNEDKIIFGPYFKIGDSTLVLKKVDQSFGRASCSVSYVKNSGKASSGSGVVFKLKAKAISKGSAAFTINKDKLEIFQSDGRYIDNFQSLAIDSLNINIQ